jgi:REP element-mobilizing transposase RayT
MTTKTRNRTSSTIPFGFQLHPNNEHLLIENPEEKKIVDEVRLMKESQSLRTLTKYVEAHTSRKLTPRGIQKIIKRSY